MTSSRFSTSTERLSIYSFPEIEGLVNRGALHLDRLDGEVVDGREIAVQFAKYGPNAERMYRDDYYREGRRRSRSISWERHERDRYRERKHGHRYRTSSYNASPEYVSRGRGRYEDERWRSRSRSFESASPRRRSPKPSRSVFPRRTLSPRDGRSPERRSRYEQPPNPKFSKPTFPERSY